MKESDKSFANEAITTAIENINLLAEKYAEFIPDIKVSVVNMKNISFESDNDCYDAMKFILSELDRIRSNFKKEAFSDKQYLIEANMKLVQATVFIYNALKNTRFSVSRAIYDAQSRMSDIYNAPYEIIDGKNIAVYHDVDMMYVINNSGFICPLLDLSYVSDDTIYVRPLNDLPFYIKYDKDKDEFIDWFYINNSSIAGREVKILLSNKWLEAAKEYKEDLL